MARSLMKTSIFDVYIRSSSTLVYLAPIYIQPDLTPICAKESVTYNCKMVSPYISFRKTPLDVHFRYLCSRVTPKKLCWEGSSRDILLKNLESFIKNHKLDEAWVAYTDFTKLYGLPDAGLLSRFITELSYSTEPKWLQKACNVVISVSKKKSNMIQFDLLHNLSLSLARAQMPVPTSMILRIMIEKKNTPPTNLLGPCVLHMVKKEIGAYLASNMLIQICDLKEKLDISVFNLVLDACANYKLSFKAEKIIEMMSEMGVIGDAYTIISIARTHAINGQRDELTKFKHCVDQVAGYLGHHYFQFYDCLMSLHFKFNDIDSASKLIFDMMSFDRTRKGPYNKSFLIPRGSRNLREGLKLQVSPHLFLENSVMKVDRNEGFVMYKNGKLLFTNKTLAKLVLGYKRVGRISELSKILNRIQTEYGLMELSDLSSDVVEACIHVGWLETAHDIIDDMEQEGTLLRTASYALLLKAYSEGNKHREANAFSKQMKKSGITLSDKPSVSSKTSDFTTYFVQETKLGETDSSIYKFNSSIYFFMKAKMIDDALKAYKTMQRTKIHHPNAATYIYMAMGYSSLEMYREVAILWGDIKRSYDDGNVVINIDLYDVLVLNFLKGGYFERVMEVISYMKKDGMYSDKWFYKSEFMKLHKDLYRVLKSSDARTEAQSKRLAYVKAFRNWADIDSGFWGMMQVRPTPQIKVKNKQVPHITTKVTVKIGMPHLYSFITVKKVGAELH